MRKIISENRTLLSLYFVWFFINFICLFISDGKGSHYFYPFGTTGYKPFDGITKLHHSYDISEFMVYAISPAILIGVYFLLKTTKRVEP